MKKSWITKSIIITMLALSLMSFCENGILYSQESITVIFLLDDSGSMANSDPDDLRYSAARLFVSLLDPGDSVGAVIFSDQARAITAGIETINSMEDKYQFADIFQPSLPNGYTDVLAGFSMISELLQTGSSETGQTIIIFLTDGQPEPLNYYSSYEDDTIELAKSLDIPVISIALTQSASINFLTRISAQTMGDVYPAETALDLLDVYLHILSQWKHRIIVGDGVIDCPCVESVTIDQGLVPYINHISFAVSKDDNVNMTLIDPEGAVVDESSPLIEFYRLNDTKFSVISLNTISAGDWQVQLEGSGKAQVRVIVESSLQIGLPNLGSFAEAGQPLLLEAEIIEIDSIGMSTRVVGEGGFSAIVTLPDGTEESLDQFYDDGTHGDITANDGLYSRVYSNTTTHGTYSIRLFGYKGLIPLQSEDKITLIDFPKINIESPQSITYNLEDDEQIPIVMNLITEEGEGLDSGAVKARFTNEKGETSEFELINDGTNYEGIFTPDISGHYILEVFVEDGSYQTMTYSHSKSIEFDVFLVPRLTFELEGNHGDLVEVENDEITRGISIGVNVSSTADKAVAVSAAIEGTSEIYIEQPGQITIPAGATTTIDLLLKSVSELSLGEKAFQIVFSSVEDVSLVDSVIPLSILVFRPTIAIENSQPVFCDNPIGCYWWKSEILLTINSTSKEEEHITLNLSGDDHVSLEETQFNIVPGKQEILITVVNDGYISKGLKEYSVFLLPDRDTVFSEQEVDGITIQLQLPALVLRCKKTIMWTIIGCFGLVIFIQYFARRLKLKSQENLISGTFQYWHNNNPLTKTTVDLTELRKKKLIIGSDPDCDIPIASSDIEHHHIRLIAKKNEGHIDVILEPLAEVMQGYGQIISEMVLSNETAFTLGEIHCRYLSDSGY